MDDAREWARGKTALELLDLSGQMFNGLVQVANAQPQAQYQAAPAAGLDLSNMDDDQILDVRTARQLLSQQAQPQPDLYLQQNMAQLAYSQARQADPKTFGKYEPEILGQLNLLPRTMWNLDTIQRVVRMVRADHIEELASERAEQLAGQRGFGVRTSGSAGHAGGSVNADHSLESDTLPADYRERLKKANVTIEQVREFSRSNGMTVEAWFKMAAKTGGIVGGGSA